MTRNSEENKLDKDSVYANFAHTAEHGKIVIYSDENGNTELRADIKKETIWAVQDQIATLFCVSRPNITMHLNKIFKTGELVEASVSKDYLLTARDGKQYITKLYNLDAIIAVGYRVNSKKATQFRIWATRILREYVVRGYSLDNKILAISSEKIEGLREAIELIQSNENSGKLKGKITIKLTKNMEAK